jgi:hypothetical protein
MSFKQFRPYETEDELPDSDDELIMSVLNDLGIQERPDVDTASRFSYQESTNSSCLEVAELAPKRASVAFSEASDGWTIVSLSSSFREADACKIFFAC